MARVCRAGRHGDGRGQRARRPTRPTPSTGWSSLRDPSHARALPLAEHLELFRRAGLPEPRVTHYRLEGELESLIARSFPQARRRRDAPRIFADSLSDDALGIAGPP